MKKKSTQNFNPSNTGTSSNDGGGSVFEIGGNKRRRSIPSKVRTNNKRRVVATKRPLVSVSSSQSQHEESQKRKKKRKSPPRLSLHRRVSASSVRMVSDSQGSTQSLQQQQPKNTSDALRNVLRRDEDNDKDVELRRHRERSMVAIEEEEDADEDEDKNIMTPMEDPAVPQSSQEVTYSKDTKKSTAETNSSTQVDLNQEMKVLARSSRTSRHRDPLVALLK